MALIFPENLKTPFVPAFAAAHLIPDSVPTQKRDVMLFRPGDDGTNSGLPESNRTPRGSYDRRVPMYNNSEFPANPEVFGWRVPGRFPLLSGMLAGFVGTMRGGKPTHLGEASAAAYEAQLAADTELVTWRGPSYSGSGLYSAMLQSYLRHTRMGNKEPAAKALRDAEGGLAAMPAGAIRTEADRIMAAARAEAGKIDGSAVAQARDELIAAQGELEQKAAEGSTPEALEKARMEAEDIELARKYPELYELAMYNRPLAYSIASARDKGAAIAAFAGSPVGKIAAGAAALGVGFVFLKSWRIL